MSEPSIIKPEDINPNYQWHRRVPSHGTMNVDYEERINFQRLHKYRLGRAKQALNNSKQVPSFVLIITTSDISQAQSLVNGREIKLLDTHFYLKAMTLSCGILDLLQNIIKSSLLGFLKKIGKLEW